MLLDHVAPATADPIAPPSFVKRASSEIVTAKSALRKGEQRQGQRELLEMVLSFQVELTEGLKLEKQP